MAVVIRETIHVIDGASITVRKYAATTSEPTVYSVAIGDANGDTAVLRFQDEGFALFKAVMNEYY